MNRVSLAVAGLLAACTVVGPASAQLSGDKVAIRKGECLVPDMYVLEVDRPSESATPWDCLRLIRVVPGDEAFQLSVQRKCAQLKKDTT